MQLKPVCQDLTQFKRPLTSVASVDEFYKKFSNSDHAYSIAMGNTNLDIEVHYRDPRRIIFFFSGALDREKTVAPPCFSMRNISAKTKATCVFISDTSFYLNDRLRIGWYGGSQEAPLQKTLPDVLDFIKQSIGAHDALYFGGSGGGFASLYYARHMPGALSFVWNPQTILENYYGEFVSHYAHAAFACSKEALSSHITTHLPNYYKNTTGTNRVIYTQTITDPHVKKHLQPFLESRNHHLPGNTYSGWIDDTFYVHMTDWSQGHSSPPAAILTQMLVTLGDPDFVWTNAAIKDLLESAEKTTTLLQAG